jgi:hypothetical protein
VSDLAVRGARTQSEGGSLKAFPEGVRRPTAATASPRLTIAGSDEMTERGLRSSWDPE